MATKPSSNLEWTVGNPSFGTVTQEPTTGKKTTGFTANERVAFQTLNWLFYQLDQWIKYFTAVTDLGAAAAYQAVVADTGGTHTTLAAALADSSIAANARIYVRNSVTQASPAQITKNGIRIEFAPGATLSKGGSASSAIQISANDVKIVNGRFVGYSGGGDKGILIDATSLRSRIVDCNFSNCTVNISDLEGATGVEQGSITE